MTAAQTRTNGRTTLEVLTLEQLFLDINHLWPHFDVRTSFVSLPVNNSQVHDIITHDDMETLSALLANLRGDFTGH